ncbi:MAG TPA: cytochrome c biogenesis CcdA family protein, partial [Nonomuraea sp.]|nr:cytochrome c biogenesis CcdA family protein [Nonomuraea sp.]
MTCWTAAGTFRRSTPRCWEADLDSVQLTLVVAVAAGLLSFLSPCVLPLVPAYLGQLTAIAVVGQTAATPPSRWLAVRHALAFVVGFGGVFTILGLTATYLAGPLVDYLPLIRQVGGIVLVLLGLNLAGLLRIPALEQTWRPLQRGAAGSLAEATGSIALASPGGGPGAVRRGPSVADRLGGRLVSSKGGWLASFGLGAIFAVGWTPCIGVILGGILGLAATSSTAGQGVALLAAYTAGLGLPFVAIAAIYDRAPRVLGP